MMLQIFLTPGDWAGIVGITASFLGGFFVIIFQLGVLYKSLKMMEPLVAEIPSIKTKIAAMEPIVAEIPGIKAKVEAMNVEIHAMNVKVDELRDASRIK